MKHVVVLTAFVCLFIYWIKQIDALCHKAGDETLLNNKLSELSVKFHLVYSTKTLTIVVSSAEAILKEFIHKI